MAAKILLYDLKNLAGKKIQKLCGRLNIEIVKVKQEDFSKPLKVAAGLAEAEESISNGSEVNFSEPMLVLVDFTEELLDRYLKEYKVMHIPPSDLKAVLTEHNQNWNAMKLYQELCGEREYFRNNHKQ